MSLENMKAVFRNTRPNGSVIAESVLIMTRRTPLTTFNERDQEPWRGKESKSSSAAAKICSPKGTPAEDNDQGGMKEGIAKNAEKATVRTPNDKRTLRINVNTPPGGESINARRNIQDKMQALRPEVR